MERLPDPPPPTALAQRGSTLAVPAADHVLTPDEQASVEGALLAAWAPETRRAYAREWRAFVGWCAANGRQALPAAPATVAAYYPHRALAAGKSALTQARAIIAHMHGVRLGVVSPTEDPAVRHALKGARRIAARRRPEVAKAPLTVREIERLVRRVAVDSLQGKRDRALLLIGFATAMRRSELVAIEVEHVRVTDSETALITIPHSKTNQDGKPEVVAVKHWCHRPKMKALCPLCALREWAHAAGIRSGPIFRGIVKGGREARGAALNAAEVARIVQKYAEKIGLDPDRFGGHSLRAGFVTEAFRRGISEVKIMGQTRHKSLAMLARYRREADPVAQGAADLFDGVEE